MIALGIEKACFASSAGALCRQQGVERACADCDGHVYLLYPHQLTRLCVLAGRLRLVLLRVTTYMITLLVTTGMTP